MEHYAVIFIAFILVVFVMAVNKNRFELYGIDAFACLAWLMEFWDSETRLLGICILTLLFSNLGRVIWTLIGTKRQDK